MPRSPPASLPRWPARLGPVLASAVAASAPRRRARRVGAGWPGADGVRTGTAASSGPRAPTVSLPRATSGWIDHGVVVGWPTGAEGKPGSPGGAAGSAGSSTAGAAGGHVTITSGSAIGVPIVTSATGGGGGDAAEPGAIGPGGPGGPGAMIRRRSPANPTVASSSARHRADRRRDPARARRRRGQGADGTDGSLAFDGTPLTVPVSTAGGSDGALATSVPLALLLVSDQGNAVDHLDARTADDLVAVVARYHWLARVTAPFAAGDDPSHGSVHRRGHRGSSSPAHLGPPGARCGSARASTTTATSSTGCPCCRWRALQARVASLLDLGKLVEDTYLGYQQQGATTETRLSCWTPNTSTCVAKIAADQAAIAALDSAVDDAEAQVTASLQPLIDQQQRLVDDEFEFKEQFVAYVTGQAACSFLGVLQAMVGIVVSAAEVAVGVGEIAVLTEAATMTEMAASIVKVVKAVEAEVEDIKKAVESVQSLTATDVDAAKFVVDEQKFDNLHRSVPRQVPRGRSLGGRCAPVLRTDQGSTTS